MNLARLLGLGYRPGVLSKRIIPCLDVKDGRVVKGVRFLGPRDAGDPVEAARRYDAEGADEITFLDITASHERRATLLDVVARTADAVLTPLTVGTLEHLREGLVEGKADAALAASIFHDGLFTIAAAKGYLEARGVPVRLDRKELGGPG